MNKKKDFGTYIQEYDVLDAIGKGGFATVYRAICRNTGKNVAIKKIDKKVTARSGLIERVRQEVSIHSKLDHPSILKLHIYFEDSYFVYLVLELCINGELQKYLKNIGRPLTEDEAREFLVQVVSGMLYLHSQGIMHRDLTLSNILLDANNKTKIADFGLATQLKGPGDRHMTLCGTANYMSPEVASRGSHGLEADVWSFGCMMYIMLVGKPPFDSEAVKSTLTRVVMGDYKIPSFISPAAKDLITKCLQKNVKERIRLDLICQHPFMLNIHSDKHRYVLPDSGIYTMSTMSSVQDSKKPLMSFSPPVNMKSQPGAVISTGEYSYANQDEFSFPSHVRKICTLKSKYPLLPSSFKPRCNRERDVSEECKRLGKKSSLNHKSSSVPWLNDQCESLSLGEVKYPLDHTQAYIGHTCHSLEEGRHGINRNNAHFVCSYEQERGHQMGFTNKHSTAHSAGGDFANNLFNEPYFSITNKESLTRSQSSPSATKEKKLSSQCSPLSSKRLRPTRQKAKNAVLTILPNGYVCIERFKFKKGTEMVFDICWISGDGLRIAILQPNTENEYSIGSVPSPCPDNAYPYSYESLPEKHWKKYIYAARFVKIVKAKTPKLTFYSEDAKCMLMENFPDPNFEAFFYNGYKYVQSSKATTVTSPSGSVFHIYNDDSQDFNVQAVMQHAKAIYNHCLKLDGVMTENASSMQFPCFPIIIGRKPSAVHKDCNKENMSPQSVQSFQPSPCGTQLGPYESLLSHHTYRSSKAEHSPVGQLADIPPLIKNEDQEMVKRFHVPRIGWATMLPSGETVFDYEDGTQLKMYNGASEVCFSDGKKSETYSCDHNRLPLKIQNKLCQMREVLIHISQEKLNDHKVIIAKGVG